MVKRPLAGRRLAGPIHLDSAPAALVAVAGDHLLPQRLIGVVALTLAAPLDVGARTDMHEVRIFKQLRLLPLRGVRPLDEARIERDLQNVRIPTRVRVHDTHFDNAVRQVRRRVGRAAHDEPEKFVDRAGVRLRMRRCLHQPRIHVRVIAHFHPCHQSASLIACSSHPSSGKSSRGRSSG